MWTPLTPWHFYLSVEPFIFQWTHQHMYAKKSSSLLGTFHSNKTWDERLFLGLYIYSKTWNFRLEEMFVSFAVDQKTRKFIIPQICWSCFHPLGPLYKVSKIGKNILLQKVRHRQKRTILQPRIFHILHPGTETQKWNMRPAPEFFPCLPT